MTRLLLTIVFFQCVWNGVHCQNNEPHLHDLKTEYLINPLGLDEKSPRLKWKIKDPRKGAKQKAYEIIVGIDSTDVMLGKGSHWNSGKISSDKQLVVYDGKPEGLTPEVLTRIYGEEDWSATIKSTDEDDDEEEDF